VSAGSAPITREGSDASDQASSSAHSGSALSAMVTPALSRTVKGAAGSSSPPEESHATDARRSASAQAATR